jgi:hypothetical protein
MIGRQLLDCGHKSKAEKIMSLAKTQRAQRWKRGLARCLLDGLAREPSSFAWFAYFAVKRKEDGVHGTPYGCRRPPWWRFVQNKANLSRAK